MDKVQITNLDLIFRRYWYTGLSEKEAVAELQNRGVPLIFAKLIELSFLPFIGVDRYFAILEAEDFDDWDNFGMQSSITTNFFLSLPVVLLVAAILYFLGFEWLETLYALIAWPIQGILAAANTRITFGKWWLGKDEGEVI